MARYQALDGVEEATRALGMLRANLREGLRAVVRTATERTLHGSRAQAPIGRVQGGATREALQRIYFDEGDTGAVFVGPTTDRRGRRRAKNLPIWLEYGTRRANPRPFLVPPGAAAGRDMTREALRLVTDAVRKAEV